MGPGDTIGLIAVVLLLMVVLVFGSEIFKRVLAYKERQLMLTADKTAEKAAQYASHVEQLEARVRVLERIATDKGADLALQIEELRGPALAGSQFKTEERA